MLKTLLYQLIIFLTLVIIVVALDAGIYYLKIRSQLGEFKLVDNEGNRTSLHIPHENSVWTLNPGAVVNEILEGNFNATYEINQQGFKAVPAKKNYTKKIIFFGDSYTFGSGVSNNETFTNILSNALNDEIQVINAGVSGYGIIQMYSRFLESYNSLKADDIVVFSPISKDIVRSMNDFDHVSEYMLFTGLQRYPIYENGIIKIISLNSNYYLIKALMFNAPLTGRIFRNVSRILNQSKDINQAKLLIEKVKSYTEEKKAKFILVFLPQPSELKKGKYKINVSDFDAFDIRKYYPLDDISLEQMKFKDDSHWTYYGHKETANAIMEMFKTNNILSNGDFKNSDFLHNHN
jgi:hypothetical protein